jgi:hypothetical protein
MATPTRKKISFDEPAVPAAPIAPAPAPTSAAPVSATTAQRHSTRVGKRGVQMWLSPEAYRQLRLIAAREDLQIQDCLTEALDMFFQSRGEHRIACKPG